VRQSLTPAAVATAAIRAGDDILLMPPDAPATITALVAALRADPGFRRVVQRAAARVLVAKHRLRTRTLGAPVRCPAA